MSLAKTTAERVSALRQRRADLGLVRLDVYVHADDVAKIRALIDRLMFARLQSVKEQG
jgi:hypothetical protein